MDKQIKKPASSTRRRRTKEQTKVLLIEAVGAIIKAKGYDGLSENRTARQAGVSKELICKYFGTPEKLIEEYVLKQSQPIKYPYLLQKPDKAKQEDKLGNLIKTSLENDYQRLTDNQELHSIFLSEITGKRIKISKGAREGEQTESPFFTLICDCRRYPKQL